MRAAARYLVTVLIATGAMAQEPSPADDPRPPWQRLLTGEDLTRAAELQLQINVLESSGKRDEALARHEELLALRTRLQGADHWETVNQRWLLDRTQRFVPLTADQRAAWRTAAQRAVEAQQLQNQGRFAQAEPLWRHFLEACEQFLGAEHPYTAAARNSLGHNLNSQGRYPESQSQFELALGARLKALGEHHPETATSILNLAATLDALGQHTDAETLHRKALALRLELFSERHAATASSYNGLAYNLNAQGRFREAHPLYEQALDLRRELLGEKHLDTAMSYNNVAHSLNSLGRFADARARYVRAFELFLELLSDKHPMIVTGYLNLAGNLDSQGNYAEAEPYYRQALELCRELGREQHPSTAIICGNLAYNLQAQERYVEAQALYLRSLDVHRATLGEKHPYVAGALGNLGSVLNAQAKYGEAQPQFQAALDLCRELFGDRHPQTGMSYNNLAFNLAAQRRYSDAQPLYEQALALTVQCLGAHHPDTVTCYNNLAANLYSLGRDADVRALLTNAAVSYETARLSVSTGGLGRAVFGSERSVYPFLAVIQARENAGSAWVAAERDLARGLSDEAGARKAVVLSAIEEREQAQRRERLEALQAQILDLVSKPAPSISEQEVLARCVDERRELEDAAAALAVLVSQREQAALTELQRALPGDAAVVFWVDFSGTFGHIQEHWGCVVRHTGDPRWERLPGTGPQEAWTDEDLALPRQLRTAAAGGALLAEVSDLAQRLYRQRIARLEPHLDGVRRLYVVPVYRMNGVPVELLTDKYTPSYVPSGTFLARLRDLPQPQATSLLAIGDPVIPDAPPSDGSPFSLASRGGDWSELPGTSVEVARLRALVGEDQTTTLTRSDASEQALEQLRVDGKLKDFRYLHFATHGEPNNARSFESALILAQEQITGEIPKGGAKYYDGRLTANEVLENWELNADMVTLSACESALGRPGGGDGLLGFAQAFLLAGSRSLCLSLWKVDDTATALLMDRFYQNLLGKRDGLEQPLPKADALAEAKQWLRNLTLDEATQLAADLSQGVARGKNEPALALALPTADPQEASATDNHPFAHPRYWAAFILIGDPE